MQDNEQVLWDIINAFDVDLTGADKTLIIV